jgi:hypothetical protein
VTDTGIILDFDRSRRIGLDEAILCSGKSAEQLEQILTLAASRSVSLLLTRLGDDLHEELRARTSHELDYDAESSTAFFRWVRPEVEPLSRSTVAVLSGGSSDRKVAREAMRTLEYCGIDADPYFDVGIAGLWRLQERVDRIREYPVIIVVAGMEGALPSVVGGLCSGVVIAVPTSTGYGVAEAGKTALFAALTSCAPGIVVTNIDNGYGAAAAALRFVNAGKRGRLRKSERIDRSEQAAPGAQDG